MSIDNREAIAEIEFPTDIRIFLEEALLKVSRPYGGAPGEIRKLISEYENSHSAELSVSDLINKLKVFPPDDLVVIRGIRDFNPVFEVESVPIWKVDDPLHDKYTDDMLKGLNSHERGEGKLAAFIR